MFFQRAGDPGVLATARTLFPSAGPPVLPALGNLHLLPYGVQEGEAVMQTAAGLIPPLLVLIALMPMSLPAFKLGKPAKMSAEEQSRSAAYAEALQIVQATPGLIYTDDMSLLMRTGKELPAEPSIVTNLSLMGRWDETPLLKMILEHKFSLILLTLTPPLGSTWNDDRQTPKVREAILAAYGAGERIAEFTVFRPKPR